MRETERRRQTYIDGNTVRRMEAVPDYPDEREERRREEERRRNRNTARRNQERMAHMNLGYVVFLSMAVLVTAFVSVSYIHLQSGITNQLKTISGLESQIADLKADNDATAKKIETSVNLNAVKDIAVNQLGMVYAGADQIVHYSVEKEDYMNQLEEIPTN